VRLSVFIIGASLAVGLAAVPDTAEACRMPDSGKRLFHKSLDPAPEGGIIAYVKILKVDESTKMTARIISVLRGNFTGTDMTIIISAISDCDATARAGDLGIVAGKVLSSEHGHIVLEALMDPNLDRYFRIALEPLPSFKE
jgi:hypothetical protein